MSSSRDRSFCSARMVALTAFNLLPLPSDFASTSCTPESSSTAPGSASSPPTRCDALPILPPPPYEPGAMTATIGWTGLVTYSNTNGVAMILSFAMMGVFFMLPMFLEAVLGYGYIKVAVIVKIRPFG